LTTNKPPDIRPYNDALIKRYEMIDDRLTFCKAWRWAKKDPTTGARILRVIGMTEDNLYSTPDQRSTTRYPKLIQQAINYLFTNVWISGSGEKNIKFMKNGIPRYRPQADGTMTFCNIFVSDITRILHCEIPNNPEVTDVNSMKRWLLKVGRKFAWSDPLLINSAKELQDEVNHGKVVIMLRSGENPNHQDHVALVRPGAGQLHNDVFYPTIAQAGSKVTSNIDSWKIFNKFKPDEILFFKHD